MDTVKDLESKHEISPHKVRAYFQAVEKVFSTACFCLNLFYVSTLIKRGKGEISYDGCFKNHRDERVSVSVEELVPQDHFLRAIEATISFDFIEEKLRPYYCENNGRPSIHPIVLFKMMFIGYFTAFVLSVNWKRRLKRILPTVGFRVFYRILFHHSTISWNRRTRFIHTNIFEEILMRL